MAGLDDIGEDFVLCNVCSNEYDENQRSPKLLPCLHTVCGVCVRTCITGAILKCPTCSEAHQRQQFVELVTDSTMKNMMDMIRIQKRSSTILCSDCPDGNKGDSFCSDCCVFLCNECTSAHKRTQITRRHSVVSVDNLKTSGIEIFNRKEMCSLPGHEGHPFTFYCDERSCQKPVCMQCVVIDHSQAKGHRVRNLTEVYDENKVLVEKMVGELLNKITSVCGEMKNLESEGATLDDKYTAITGQIDSLFDRMESQLRDRRTSLKKEVEDVFSVRKEEVVEQHQNLQKAKTDMENSCNYSSRMLAFTNMTEFLQLRGMVQSRLGHLIELEGTELSANKIDLQLNMGKDGHDFQEIINAIGIVKTGSEVTKPQVAQQNHTPPTRTNGVAGRGFKSSMIKPERQTSLEATKPASTEKAGFDGNRTFPLLGTSYAPEKSSVVNKVPSTKPLVEPLQLDGLNGQTDGQKNTDSNTGLLGKAKPLETKKPITFGKVVGGVKSPSGENNILGRPLSLKSPVIQPAKKPTSLGEFLKAHDDVVPVVEPVPVTAQPVKQEPVTRVVTGLTSPTSSAAAAVRAGSKMRAGGLPVRPMTSGQPSPKSPKSPVITESSYANAKQSPTTPKSPPSDKPVAFGDITCPEFHLDISSAHPEREVSADGRTLRNKKMDIFTSSPGIDLDNHLVQYKGAIGTYPFKEPGRYYYEVDVMYNIQQPLEETWLVFEIGVCRLDDIDMHHTVERHPHSRSFYVARYPENGMLAQEFWHNRDLLAYSLLSENNAGLEVHVTYGLLMDTRRKKWVVVDSNNNKVLHTFEMLDVSEALYPVFGCYNPDLITVEMTLKTGSEVTVIPQCLKTGYR